MREKSTYRFRGVVFLRAGEGIDRIKLRFGMVEQVIRPPTRRRPLIDANFDDDSLLFPFKLNPIESTADARYY